MHDHSERRFRTQNVAWQARLLGVELASFKARACAFSVDSLIVALLLLAPGLLPKPSSSSAAAPPARRRTDMKRLR